MKTTIHFNNKNFLIDFSKPNDISIPLRQGKNQLLSWNISPLKIEPVVSDKFIGDVNQGGSFNFKNIIFNPHGHGTHTECVGHISKEDYTINQCLKKFFFIAQVITVSPTKIGNDFVILLSQIEPFLEQNIESLIIRTLPNDIDKLNKNYSNTNPPYIHEEVAVFLTHKGIKHLMIDLPSVDKEHDERQLKAHKAFWDYPKNPRIDCTITELIYVPDYVIDDIYLLNIQIASFENDASPSKPILYKLFIESSILTSSICFHT